MRVRLATINKKVTSSISFEPTSPRIDSTDTYQHSTMNCLETPNAEYDIVPVSDGLSEDWNIYAYDESVQNYRALEGDLMFCSSALVKVEDHFSFNLSVFPYFLTTILKFKEDGDDAIRYTQNFGEERNLILVHAKRDSILQGTEPQSIVLIDGPLIGGNASTYIIEMDDQLRERDCIPLYFVKNSDSRMVVDNDSGLRGAFNSDLHWAVHQVKSGHRSAFFRYEDQLNPRNSKVFTYLKALPGLPQRLEMHSRTYQKYKDLLPKVLGLVAYFYLAQGDYHNPQVRPIAIAEKYAREGLKMLNIPVRLLELGFHPTVNQVRFG